MKKILILLFVYSILYSEVMEFNINYIGIPVVKSHFEYFGDSLIVISKSTGFSKILKKLDNKYIATYSQNDTIFLPVSYKKIINQRDYKEKRIVFYNRKKKSAELYDYYNPQKSKKYNIVYDVRDFFSTLFYLRNNLFDNVEFNIDANSVLWKGKATFIETCFVKINGENIKAKKYKITYEKISLNIKKENSDMLTNNLVGKNKILFLWFSDDKYHIPIKAKFKRKPFSVFWMLTKYKR